MRRIAVLLAGVLSVMTITGCRKDIPDSASTGEAQSMEENASENNLSENRMVPGLIPVEITPKNVRIELDTSGMEASLYEQLPAEYGYEDAIADSLFIISDMQVISGEEKWEDFLQNVSEDKACSVLIGEYYELGDESHYSKEYYESVKDEYPQFYLKELFYDGTSYRLVTYEEDQTYENVYPYMIERSGKMSDNAKGSMSGYFLVKNTDVSFHDLMWAVLSSNSADWIDYRTVFMKEE